MDLLARREHPFFELQQKLSLRFPDADQHTLTGVLDTLRHENLQSDERFTESYIRYRKSRGFGYMHIRTDLAARRIAPATIEKYLQQDDEDWLQLASALVTKKLNDCESLEFGCKQHRRLVRLLESRGFSNPDIRKVLEKRLVYKPACRDYSSVVH